jgi:hypothetical protein
MRRIIISVCFLIFSFNAYCFEPDKMSIQLSPVSFKVWGSTPSTISLQAQYKWLMLGYYHIVGQYTDELRSPTRANTFGAFYKPDIPVCNKLTISPILGIFNHRFPTENGAWWAFGLNLNFNATKHLGFYLQHLSNAKTAKINPGLDVMGVKFTF